jgi:hypothetical protein
MKQKKILDLSLKMFAISKRKSYHFSIANQGYRQDVGV